MANPPASALEQLHALLDRRGNGGDPAIAAAATHLASIGPWTDEGPIRLKLPGGQAWLVHVEGLSGEQSVARAIDAFEVRRAADGPAVAHLVRKSMWRDGTRNPDGLYDEALVYAGIGPELKAPHLRVPSLHACQALEDGVTLVIERAAQSDRSNNWPAVSAAARALGELGAVSHGRQHHMLPWLRSRARNLRPETLVNLQRLTDLCLINAQARRATADAMVAALGEPELVRRMEAETCPCLSHGDAYMRNLIACGPDGMRVIVDWGNVRRGYIGQDAAMLLLPGFINMRQLRRVSDFAHGADSVFEALRSGVETVDPAIDPRQVRTGLDLALLYAVLQVGDRYFNLLNQPGDAEEQQVRRNRASSILHFARRTAEDLARRFA